MQRLAIAVTVVVGIAAIVIGILVKGSGAVPPHYEKFKLDSGRTLKIIQMGRLDVRSGRPTIKIKYETPIFIWRERAVQTEADAIWKELRADSSFSPVLQENHITEAILEPTNSARGILSIGGTSTLIYRRAPNGSWAHVASDE